MMIKVILCLLYLSLVLSQDASGVKPRDLFDETDLLLREFEDLVDEVTARATRQLQETESHVAALGQAVGNIGRRILSQIQTELLEELNDLEAKAQNGGFNIIGCTYDAKRDISRWPPTLQLQIQQCVYYRTEDSLYSIHQAFANLENINELVPNFARQVAECQVTNDLVCLATVRSHIYLQYEMLPAILDADIQEVLRLYENMEPYFQQCTDSPTHSMRIRGRTVVDSAVKCADVIMGS